MSSSAQEQTETVIPMEDTQEEATSSPAAVVADEENDSSSDLRKSALRDNIDQKGKNAYYYAHSATATGPTWDGKPQPKLLGRQPSDLAAAGGSATGNDAAAGGGFHYHKSNITNYAFSDEGAKVRMYITLPDLLEKCPDDDAVTLEHTFTSFCLVVKRYPSEEEERCLSFGRLWGEIEGASFRKKKDRIVLTLVKKKPEEEGGEPKEWDGVAAKGAPDQHEVF